MPEIDEPDDGKTVSLRTKNKDVSFRARVSTDTANYIVGRVESGYSINFRDNTGTEWAFTPGYVKAVSVSTVRLPRPHIRM